MMFSALGALIGPPISGAILKASGGLEGVSYYAGKCSIDRHHLPFCWSSSFVQVPFSLFARLVRGFRFLVVSVQPYSPSFPCLVEPKSLWLTKLAWEETRHSVQCIRRRWLIIWSDHQPLPLTFFLCLSCRCSVPFSLLPLPPVKSLCSSPFITPSPTTKAIQQSQLRFSVFHTVPAIIIHRVPSWHRPVDSLDWKRR